MSLPAPKPGLVICYSFLWSGEHDRGAREGAKDRPCAIVLAVRRGECGDLRAVVAPITHALPEALRAAIEIPARTRMALGLDNARQWLRADELNAFSWPGFDLRPIPGRENEYAYGMAPPSLFEKLRALILKRDAERKARRIVERD
jgi:hypothetical protein